MDTKRVEDQGPGRRQLGLSSNISFGQLHDDDLHHCSINTHLPSPFPPVTPLAPTGPHVHVQRLLSTTNRLPHGRRGATTMYIAQPVSTAIARVQVSRELSRSRPKPLPSHLPPSTPFSWQSNQWGSNAGTSARIPSPSTTNDWVPR